MTGTGFLQDPTLLETLAKLYSPTRLMRNSCESKASLLITAGNPSNWYSHDMDSGYEYDL